jgi:integrase
MRRLPTVREIDRLTERGRYACGHGLYLQVSQWGTRSWIFRYRRDGRARHVGLGSCTYITLAEARMRAFEYRRLLAKGGDPLGEKRGVRLEQQRAEARSKTFQQVALEYIDAHEHTWRGDASRKQWAQSLESYAFPKIGAIPVADITVTDILSVLDPIARKIPETAGRIKHRLAKILDWAHSRDLRPNDNPARRANLLPKRKHAKSHFAAMAYTALPAFMSELRQRPENMARALELLILTAARPNEILGMRWGEIDLSAAMWTIPAARMKASKPHRVSLSGRAVELLAALPRAGELVFAGRFTGVQRRSTELIRPLRLMGHGVTVHGFRATFKTWASERTNYARELIEVALAHAVGDAVEEAYNRGDMLARRRQLMESWAEYCSRPHVEGDVVPLRQIGLGGAYGQSDD